MCWNVTSWFVLHLYKCISMSTSVLIHFTLLVPQFRMTLEVQCQECRGMTGMKPGKWTDSASFSSSSSSPPKKWKKLRHLSLSGTHFQKRHFLGQKNPHGRRHTPPLMANVLFFPFLGPQDLFDWSVWPLEFLLLLHLLFILLLLLSRYPRLPVHSHHPRHHAKEERGVKKNFKT